MARVARRSRAGEDARPSCARGTSRTRRPARSSTGRHSSTSRTRWTWRPTARAIEADRDEGHRPRRRRTASTRRLKANKLDALLFPGQRAARPSRAQAGYPTVIVPFGLVPNTPTPPFRRIRREAGALRRQLHRHRVQRAAADRAGVRIRAGDEATHPSPSGLTHWNSDDRQDEVGITRGGHRLPAGRATSALERLLGPRRTTIGVVSLPLRRTRPIAGSAS